MAAVGAWPVPWASYGSRGGVAGPLGPVWRPWGLGRSPWPRMAAVGAWPLNCVFFVCRGGVASLLGPVWLAWGRGHSLSPIWQQWGRGRSPGSSMAAVGTWPVSWAPYGRRGSVAIPLRSVCPPWGRGLSPGLVWLLWGVAGPRAPHGLHGRVADHLGLYGCREGVAVPWVLYGGCGGVAGPLGPVSPPWMRGRIPGPRMAAVGAWPVPWAPYGSRGGVAKPLGPLCLP